MNSPESSCVAGSSWNFKQNLFIATSFTNLLYQFSILFVIISRQFSFKLQHFNKKASEMGFAESNNAFIKISYLIISYRLWGLIRYLKREVQEQA